MENIVKKLVIIFFQLFIAINVYAQLGDGMLSVEAKIEGFIIRKQIDSANFYISQQPTNSYLKTLDKIANKKASYSNYYSFISKVGNRTDIDYIDVSNYINLIKPPDNPDSLVYDYVKIKPI